MEESSPGSATTTDTSDLPSNPATSQRGVPLRNRLSATEAPEPLKSRKSNTRYSGFNPGLIGTPSIPPGTDRFIFVNAHESSTPGQKQRVDQKAINAHVQTIAYLQRRSAAIEKLKYNVKANVGRPRPARAPQSEAGGSYSQTRHWLRLLRLGGSCLHGAGLPFVVGKATSNIALSVMVML